MIGKIHFHGYSINQLEDEDRSSTQCWSGSGDNTRLTVRIRASRAAGNKKRYVCSFALASIFMLYVAVPTLIGGVMPRVPAAQPRTVPAAEVGVASWYGHPYHGRHAANGEIYSMYKLTAAHRTLPFGTRVRVHNLKNDRTVDVKINDRGPFIEGRIIDLSRAAAEVLRMRGAGLARVRLEMLPAATAMNSRSRTTDVAQKTPHDLPGAVAR